MDSAVEFERVAEEEREARQCFVEVTVNYLCLRAMLAQAKSRGGTSPIVIASPAVIIELRQALDAENWDDQRILDTFRGMAEALGHTLPMKLQTYISKWVGPAIIIAD